ncbi:LRMP isoform 15, partial [Pan troglodytes]
MNDDPSMEENGVERVCSENLLQSREYSSLPLPRRTSSTDGTITSSDPGLEILNMASCDLDSNSLCKKEEDTRSASPTIEAQGTSPARDNIAFQDSTSKDKTILNLEAKEEPETIEEHK